MDVYDDEEIWLACWDGWTRRLGGSRMLSGGEILIPHFHLHFFGGVELNVCLTIMLLLIHLSVCLTSLWLRRKCSVMSEYKCNKINFP
jgi:hypothetical protein